MLRHALTAALALWPLAAPAADYAALFAQVSSLVQEGFYDPELNGLDWAALCAQYRSRIRADMDREEFAALVNELLAHLRASHTAFLTRDSPDWHHLAGVFIDGYAPLREGLQAAIGSAEPVYSGIGVLTETREAGVFVTGVLQGFAAEAAGVLVGDRLVSADGQPFHAIRSFAGREGLATRLGVERRPGETLELTVTPALLDGRTLFERAQRASARVIERGGARIGYVHVWSYAGQKYQNALIDALSGGPLADAAALVLDLRAGLGGANPDYLNFFAPAALDAQSIGRNGERHRFSSAWTRPVVLLVDEGSRSGKELFAYGFRRLGKGVIVGERTAGAVLAGRIHALSDGSLLYLAVADVQIDGERLEGRGVEPDIAVPFDPAYAAGADPQLERALEVAVQQLQRTPGPAAR